MKLTRNGNWYNPFFLCQNSNETFITDEVNEIYFFNPETQEIVAKTNWFGGGSNNNYKTVELCPGTEPKRKLKQDLSLRVPFYMACNSCTYAKRIDIFVPINMVQDWSVELHINDGVTTDKLHDRWHDRATFTATACKRCIKTVNGECVSYYPDQATEQTIEFEFHHVWEDTKLCKLYAKYAKTAESVGVKLTVWEFEKLADVFNITEKRNK